jgi:hypothetical protein
MNRRLTIGLVLVFAVLVVYTLMVQVPKNNAAQTTPTTAPVTYLLSFQASQATGVHVVDRLTGKAVDLVTDSSGAWKLVNPGPQPAEQSLAAQDVTGLMTLAVNGTITTATDLAAFGVLSPTMTVEIDLADGSKVKAVVGDKQPAGSDYYALRDGETQVVVLSSAAQGTLAALISAPPVVPPTETPTLGPGTPSVTPPATATLTTTMSLTGTAASGTGTPVITVTVPASASAAATAAGTATATAVSTQAASVTPPASAVAASATP